MKKYIKYIVIFAFVSTAISSCGVMKAKKASIVKTYERPTSLVDSTLYRTDKITQDSATIFSWKEMFTDPILRGYIQKGLENNLDIRMALQNLIAAESYVKQAKAGFLPTLSVSPSYSYYNYSLNSLSGAALTERTHFDVFDITASASWEADIWGKISSQNKAQLASYLTTVAAHKAVTSGVVSGIAQAYYQLLALDEQKKITQESIALGEKSLATTKALMEAGSTTAVAIEQTKAQLLNMQSSLLTLENTISQTENALCLLLGEKPHAIKRSTFAKQKLPENIAMGYSMELLQNRPDVMSAEMQFRNAFELTNVARASLYPTLTLSASTGLNATKFGRLFDINSIFGNLVAGLTQPIFNKRALRTQLEVSEVNQQNALLSFQQTLLTAGQEVSDALKSVETQTKYIVLKQQEAEAYSKASEYSQELMNYGMANYLEVLTAQQNALNAKLAEVNAGLARMNATIALYKALGGGWK